MSIISRLRDSMGRFISNGTNLESGTEVTSVTPKTTTELVTQISTEISINGKPIDLTNLTQEDAVVLYNFGVLRKEHFDAICKLEGWRFEELVDFEEIDEDDDEE